MKLFLAAIFLAAVSSAAQTLLPTALPPTDANEGTSSLAASSDEQPKQPCIITGTVIDRASREPVAKAKVTILGTGLSAQTGNDGQYRIESIPDGIYQLKAEADKYEPEIINNISLGDERRRDKVFFTLLKTSMEPPADYIPVQKQPVPIKGHTPSAVYPELARRAGIEGMVWVKLWVDEQGNTRKAVVVKSDKEILNQASIDAAIQWKFEPAILNDKPISVWVTMPFKFKLNKDTSGKADGVKKPTVPKKNRQ